MPMKQGMPKRSRLDLDLSQKIFCESKSFEKNTPAACRHLPHSPTTAKFKDVGASQLRPKMLLTMFELALCQSQPIAVVTSLVKKAA